MLANMIKRQASAVAPDVSAFPKRFERSLPYGGRSPAAFEVSLSRFAIKARQEPGAASFAIHRSREEPAKFFFYAVL